MSIQALPPDVVAQIKSSTVITSLNGVVSELIQNSLDAGSSNINITIDYVRGGCVVEDDGLGIPPSEFEPDGGLGKLYRKTPTY
jgi:DNA mismatch repair protein MLH3